MQQTSEKVLRQRVKTRLNKVAQFDGAISGSLVKIRRKCGQSGCRCAAGGEKHSAFVLTSKVRGKTKVIYIPVDMVEEVRQWVKNHRQIKALLKEIDALSEKMIRQKVPASRAAARNRERLNP